MSDWGAYDPDRFSGLSQSDLTVDAETRKHFALAVCGVLDSYWELKEDRHFWAMSMPMRAIFARMPTRYPYYNPPAVSAQTVQLPTVRTDNQALPNPIQSGAEEATPKTRKSRSSKRDQTGTAASVDNHNTADGLSLNSGTAFPDVPARNLDIPAINLHPVEMTRSKRVKKSGSSKVDNARSQSVSTSGTPEDADSLTDTESDSPTDVSSGSVTWSARQPSAPKRTFVTHTVQLNSSPLQSRSEKILTRDSRRKKAERMKRGGSVFGNSASSSETDNPSVAKLKEKVDLCTSWRRAFKLALCSLFKYDELRDCTAAHADRKRLQLAADLVRDYCRSRKLRELAIADFHTQYSHVRRSVQPYSHST